MKGSIVRGKRLLQDPAESKFTVFYGSLDTIPRNPEPFVGSVTTVLVAEK